MSMGSLATDAQIYGPDSSAIVLNHMDNVEFTIFK